MTVLKRIKEGSVQVKIDLGKGYFEPQSGRMQAEWRQQALDELIMLAEIGQKTVDAKSKWFEIKLEGLPPSRKLVMTKGNSGYVPHETFYIAAYHDSNYRPLSPWQTVHHDSMSDYGFEPTHWKYIESIE